MDVGDLKTRIVKKIGAVKFKRYFYYLNSFLSQKLSKSDFDKFCGQVLGKDNLPLHNLFILSFLKSASDDKASPPSLDEARAAKSAIQYGNEQMVSYGGTQTPHTAIKSNGVVLPMSPRRGRSKKFSDRPSPLGPFGKSDSVSYQSTTTEDSGSKVMVENGVYTPCDYLGPTKHLEELTEQCKNQGEGSVQHYLRIAKGVVEDGEEVEKPNQPNVYNTPLNAPLGIPYCTASLGGARSALRVQSNGNYVRYCNRGGLSYMERLKIRMGQIAAGQGLGDVSLDSATLLNNMLDVYLKQLIKSCAELVGARSGNGLRNQLAKTQLIQHRLPNGFLTSSYLHLQSRIGPMENMHGYGMCNSISLLDFKAAMELNPQQLGEDWPLLLEKVCIRAFDE